MSSKGGQQTSTVKLPEEITAAAKGNLELANKVGTLPYAPYFGGSVAAFTPGQMAGFQNMNQAANAFGMQGSAGQGLPKPGNFGGIAAYSTEQPYKDAMSKVPPEVLAAYNSFFGPNGWKAPTSTPKAAAATPAQQWLQPNNTYGGWQGELGGAGGDRR